MNDTLNQLIRQYHAAKKHLVAVQDADEATFQAALKACKAIRAQMDALCPPSSISTFEYNKPETI